MWFGLVYAATCRLWGRFEILDSYVNGALHLKPWLFVMGFYICLVLAQFTVWRTGAISLS